MRQSKRSDILEAAKRVVQRNGVTTLTYESVAVESGLTKGGLLYHFPSREALILGVHEHVADQWEQSLISEAGHPAEELTDAERFAAFTRLSQNPDRAELLLMLEAGEDDAANAAWDRVYRQWAPGPPDAPPHDLDEDELDEDELDEDEIDEDAVRAFIARLAADGMWFYEALSTRSLDPAVRARLVEEIIALGGDGVEWSILGASQRDEEPSHTEKSPLDGGYDE